MKLNRFFMLGLAGLAFAACSNNDEIPGMENDGTKSVALRLEGLAASTKAVGDAQQAGQIALSNMTIYFTDGTNILTKTTLSSTDNAEDWAELTTTGYTFHKLPSAVNQIQIVGNSAGKTLTETSVANLKASVLDAAGEQTFTNVTLFGEDTTLEPQEPVAGDEHTTSVLKATVNLTPLVARFEVGNIGCSDMGDPTCAIKKYDLKVIGLMDFNSAVKLDGTAAGTEYTLANVLEPGSVAEDGEVVFGSTGQGVPNWAWDTFTGEGITGIATKTTYNPGENKKFVYQFIPNKLADGKLAQIKLVLDNIEWADGTQNPFNSVVTAKFQTADGKDLTEFAAGKIYTVDYQFPSEKIGPWNPEDVKCVLLNVTVASWEVVALTPVFE